jgi:hypothetical protein
MLAQMTMLFSSSKHSLLGKKNATQKKDRFCGGAKWYGWGNVAAAAES